MSSHERIVAMKPEITAWRRDFHEHPELLYDVHRTAGIVAEKMKSFGVDEVITGIGKTGVVGIIKGKGTKNSGRVIGMRADMDALPIDEQTNRLYSSKTPGKMHACGHDGHTAMLLGAAKYLAETRDFDGTAVMIFQPAEEGGAGAKAMIDDGVLDQYGVQEVYGMHNMPGLPPGHFAMRPGPMMASADRFFIEIEGRGGHAAKPDQCIDTVLAATQIVNMLQSIVARNVNPLHSAVLSVTSIHAGEAFNVIPQTATLLGTVRTLTEETRDLMEEKLKHVVTTTAAALGVVARVKYDRGYPVTMNDPSKTDFAADVARKIAGGDNVDLTVSPMMGAEDFSYMLEKRPGAYVFIGNGDSAFLHHPAYDFDDEVIPAGVGYWATLAETAMPL